MINIFGMRRWQHPNWAHDIDRAVLEENERKLLAAQQVANSQMDCSDSSGNVVSSGKGSDGSGPSHGKWEGVGSVTHVDLPKVSTTGATAPGVWHQVAGKGQVRESRQCSNR